MSRSQKPKGQGLVEFALVIPVMLIIILSIIEGALLFQSFLAIQHAAREAARYAVTYQPPMTYSEAQGKLLLQGINPGAPAYQNESETQWHSRRAGLIKQRALDQALGVRTIHPALDETSFGLDYLKLGFFGVRVWGFPSHSQAEQLDHPGLQGLPIRIKVYYRWEALDPLISAIVPNGVMLTGEATMINEGIQVGLGAVAPPTFAPPPTLPAPPPGTPGGPTPDPNTATPPPTPTFTPTPTPAPPTPTPSGAYIILTDAGNQEKSPWLLDELPLGFAEIHQHPGAGPYRIYWTDNCGQRTSLNIDLTPSGGFARGQLPDPIGILPGDSYLCSPLTEGQTYDAWISSCDYTVVNCSNAANDTATAQISVLVPFKEPDLIVKRFILPPGIIAGTQVTIGVEIENQGTKTVTETFDIDIYVNPPSRVLSQLPGMAPAGSGTPKQWYATNMAPGDTAILNYVLVLPIEGDHLLKAQVDTSDWVAEKDDGNNISETDLTANCSNQSDDFNAGALDPMWVLSPIGSGPGSGAASVVSSQLRIEGAGVDMWDSSDGRFHLLNQGVANEPFYMSIKVTKPTTSVDGRAGLMVREALAPGAPYVAIAIVSTGGQPEVQFFARTSWNASPTDLCGGPAAWPAGTDMWLRIVREGDTFKLYTSTDGTWPSGDPPLPCMMTVLSGFADPAVPGILMAPR